MRYGENPHQAAALYGDFLRVAEPLHGKELSYNNVVDIDAALALAEEFRRGPEAAVAILKHNTPCGVGVGRDPVEAGERAYAPDPESPFGGIVVSTHPWTLPLARAVDELFPEVLIAPDFEPAALELLRRKKARRIVRWHPEAAPPKAPALRGVPAGLLVQDAARASEDPREARVVTRRAPTAEELRALAFAWRVVKHVKSNAIAFTTAERTLALGGGQTSRVEPVRNARARAVRLGISLTGSVLASDAFFPFADGLEEAIAAGATAVIQPGGSTRDEEGIRAADARPRRPLHRRRSRSLRPDGRRRAPRGLEGVHQGAAPPRACADGVLRRVRRSRRRRPLREGGGRAGRRQGRRPRERKGGLHLPDRRRGAGGGGRAHARPAVRRRGEPRRGGGVPRGRGGLLHGPDGRRGRPAARHLPGPQAGPGRRPGAEYGRHGRLLADADRHARAPGPHHARDHGARGARPRPAGHP